MKLFSPQHFKKLNESIFDDMSDMINSEIDNLKWLPLEKDNSNLEIEYSKIVEILKSDKLEYVSDYEFVVDSEVFYKLYQLCDSNKVQQLSEESKLPEIFLSEVDNELYFVINGYESMIVRKSESGEL